MSARVHSLLARILVVIAVGSPSSLFACATCFGGSDSEMARGMNMGIFSLLAVVVVVLGTLATFFVYIARRSASHPLPMIPVQAAANTHVP